MTLQTLADRRSTAECLRLREFLKAAYYTSNIEGYPADVSTYRYEARLLPVTVVTILSYKFEHLNST